MHNMEPLEYRLMDFSIHNWFTFLLHFLLQNKKQKNM